MREFLARRWYRLVGRTREDAGPLRPVTFRSPDPLERRVLDTAARLERILGRNILPFWLAHAIDREGGGYLLNHDVAGRWKGPAERFCMSQTRTLWFFSRVAREGRSSEAASAAAHGFDFVAGRLWDSDEGGFASAVSHDGSSIVDGRKLLYDQTFALYALSEYALATGTAAAVALADRTVEVLKERYEDRAHGGFYMAFSRDWSPLEGPAGVPGKRLNETVHVLEALTVYDRIRPGDPWVRDQLHRLVLILTGTVLRKDRGASTDAHREDWTPIVGPRAGTVSYGHDLETVALVAEACDQVGIPLPLVADWMRTVVDFALRWGLDRRGGMYHAGPLDGPPWDRRKTWWVQAEVLVGALTAYRIVGDPRYAELYLGTLDWIELHHVDWKGGDWHAFVHRDGSVSGDRAYQWKGPYHNGRAMMQCLRLLVPGNPLAPGWLAGADRPLDPHAASGPRLST